MPSPFPGMDPYLESPDWFPDLHGSLIILMKGMLQRSLPESYVKKFSTGPTILGPIAGRSSMATSQSYLA